MERYNRADQKEIVRKIIEDGIHESLTEIIPDLFEEDFNDQYDPMNHIVGFIPPDPIVFFERSLGFM